MNINENNNITISMSYDAALDVINMLYYDAYGRKRVELGRAPTFAEWYTDCIHVCNLLPSAFPTEVMEAGYAFIHDLWEDNQEYGANAADGTFRG